MLASLVLMSKFTPFLQEFGQNSFGTIFRKAATHARFSVPVGRVFVASAS